MTTTVRDEQPLASDVLSALEPTDAMDTAAGSARRGRGRWLLPGLALVTIVGLGAAGFAKLAGTLGSSSNSRLLTHTVEKGELLITITEDGNLVKEGEELTRLDSSQLEDQISQQKITYEKARSAYIQAEKDYNVAKISVQEYLEGTYRQELQDLEAQIKIALENLRSAENTLQHTRRMFRKGYVSPLQREAQEFAVQRAQLELESAQTAKEVLEKFTKLKTLEDLTSKRDTAEAKKNSEGTAVREQQTIFRLPDLSKMQVKVAVHESKVDQLARGMRA